MSEDHLQIDVSMLNFESDEGNLVNIELGSEDQIGINFPKFFIQSNYIRNKYKYSEALNIIQAEITKIKEEKCIDYKSIKLFIELVHEEKASIPKEYYRDIYILSEYFMIPKFIQILDKIREQVLYNDFDFAIQILQCQESNENEIESNLTSKIEKFLRERVNECIENPKFGELPISTIYRILDESNKGSIDQKSLINFIFKSIKTRFILFKFVTFHELDEQEIREFFRNIEEQKENLNDMYFEYLPINFSIIQQMKGNYDKLFQEINRTKEESKQTKEEMNQTKEESKETKEKLNQTIEKLNQTELELNKTKIELDQMKLELKQTNQELNQTKEKLNQTELKLGQTRLELDLTKEELDQIKTSPYLRSIVVGGFNQYNQIGENANNKDRDGDQIISPPLKLSIDPSLILSYSVYYCHSVMVTSSGSLLGIGNNEEGRICGSLEKSKIGHFTEFSINDNKGRHLTPISAVCTALGTLYMLSKSSGRGTQLVYCDKEINGGNPVFLKTSSKQLVALFGGRIHCAAITSDGEVIFINRFSVISSPESRIAAVSLPGGHKASSVSCLMDSVVVLSSKGQVFTSAVEKGSNALKFTAVEELLGAEYVCVSGVNEHCFVVSKGGRVFGLGSNENGRLGLGEETKSVSSFTEITSLRRYNIRAAYAGGRHSLFETREGQILSCGSDVCGELLCLAKNDRCYTPTETTIRSDSSFCIAGINISVVFIGTNPPQNLPNRRVQQYK